MKHLSGSTTEDMMTYIKPPRKWNPDRFIIDVGTNNLRSNQDLKTFARIIIEVAYNSKTDTNILLISSIVPRRDNLNCKGRHLNIFLKKFCTENDFVYVNHDNIKPRQHCTTTEFT